MSEDANRSVGHHLAASPDDLRALHLMCRAGRLYDVERWIADEKPLQLAPEAIRKGTRPKTALQIALEGGQHSLALLLLKSGYRLELEKYAPLDLVLDARRWDLFDLLLEWGAELKDADVYTVLETYNVDLYERCRAAGYDLTQRHEIGSILGHGTSNRPLLGFVKRHRLEDSKLQLELNIALGYHARTGNEKGISLCLWAGADPHAPTPDPRFDCDSDETPEDEGGVIGWTAIEEAARAGDRRVLRRLGPDPERDDFDRLYELADSTSIVTFLMTLQPPRDIGSILSWHALIMSCPVPGTFSRGTGTIEAILKCGVCWSEATPEQLRSIRGNLRKLNSYDLGRIIKLLKKPLICAPEIFQELVRTPAMRERLIAAGLLKPTTKEAESKRKSARRRARRTRPKSK